MNHSVYFSLLIMCLTVYCIRMLPFLVFRKEITNRYVKSFLFYVPYACLAAMTFPAILTAPAAEGMKSTVTTAAGIVGFAAALFAAWKEKSLITVALVACGAVFITERIMMLVL